MSNSVSLAGGALKLSYDYLDAADRLEADLAAIYDATTAEQLELFAARLEAEKAAREVYALLAARYGVHEVNERLEHDLATIRAAVVMQDLQLLSLRFKAEKAARELNAMIQPR